MPRLLPKQHDNELAITISARTFLKVVLLIVGTVLLLSVLRKVTFALLLIFTAFFLALALNAPVSWVSRHLPSKSKNNRALATSVAYLIVVFMLAAFLFSIIPPIINQGRSLVQSAPQTVQSLRNKNNDINRLVKRYHLEKQLDEFSGQLVSRLKNISGAAVSGLAKLGGSLIATLTVLVLTFMMLVEGPRWVRYLHALLPKAKQEHAANLSRDMYKVVKGFVNGQVTLAAIASLMLLPGLIIFHVNYPIALMAVVFICGLIPMVGHTIGAIIVTIVALFHSPFSAIGILIYYILYQQIENYLIQPKVQSNTTNMTPLMVFIAVVIGVSFGGLIGGLVAIPVAGCLRVLTLDYLDRANRTADFDNPQPTNKV